MIIGSVVRFKGRKRAHVVRAVRCNSAGIQLRLRGPNDWTERKRAMCDWYSSEEFDLCAM
jgi:hypothetical protein